MSHRTYVLLLLVLTSCHQTSFTPNKKKLAGIKQHIDDAYRNNWKTIGLHGRIKSLTQFTYRTDVKDTTDADYELKEYYSFDASGNTTERIIYNSTIFDSRNVYKYNQENKNIEMANYAEDGSFNFSNYNVFDSLGNLVESGERHANGTVLNKKTYKYDKYNHMIESIINNNTSKFSNIYDE
jgi:hypothetical protein